MAKFFVAGEYRDSESGGVTEIRNPATGELVDRVPKGTVNDIRRAIDVAAGALKSGPNWARRSGEQSCWLPAASFSSRKRSW
jgi:acyl-CoA reductase-like NAD-dependent aldehyde dehydrogenase